MNKELLLDAIKGNDPSYEAMEHPLIKTSGHYSGGFSESWHWDASALAKKTEQELAIIYKTLKE